MKGAVAGCSFATTFIGAFAPDAVDPIPVLPRCDLDIYIDDSGVSASGPRHRAIADIVSSSRALRAAVADMLGCSLALSKVWAVSSS
eukprot:2183014-Pyramimonas_sp.AAC.1